MLEGLVALGVGIGLAAACGFRVFVPILVIGVAARAELLTLSAEFEWLGSWVAIAAFSTATILEIGAYYFPWLDNLLDSVSTPSAVVAGIVVTAACVYDMHPVLKWSLAVIAGGGVAGTVKAGLSTLRLGSTATTGGVGNPVFSTLEWMASAVMSLVSVFLPILAGILGVLLAVCLVRFAVKFLSRFRTAHVQRTKGNTT